MDPLQRQQNESLPGMMMLRCHNTTDKYILSRFINNSNEEEVAPQWRRFFYFIKFNNMTSNRVIWHENATRGELNS